MEKLKKDVIEIIERLESGKTVNSSDFARTASSALGKRVSVTNCVPCIKSTLKELKSWLSKLDKEDKLIKMVEPEPIKEEPKPFIEVEPKPDVKKIIKKNGKEENKRGVRKTK